MGEKFEKLNERRKEVTEAKLKLEQSEHQLNRKQNQIAKMNTETNFVRN